MIGAEQRHRIAEESETTFISNTAMTANATVLVLCGRQAMVMRKIGYHVIISQFSVSKTGSNRVTQD